MNTRKSFMDWVHSANFHHNVPVDKTRFYSIHEKEYVFGYLGSLLKVDKAFAPLVHDFRSLEERRYSIFEERDSTDTFSEIQRAIVFCAKTEDEKRNSFFRIKPGLERYLVTSSFLWDEVDTDVPISDSTSFLFLPSFLSMAPKELILKNLNSLFLDLMEFKEPFSYDDLLNQVVDVMDMEREEVDLSLLEFVTYQVLYYRTLIVTN